MQTTPAEAPRPKKLLDQVSDLSLLIVPGQDILEGVIPMAFSTVYLVRNRQGSIGLG